MSGNYQQVSFARGNVPKGLIVNGTALVGAGVTATPSVGPGSYLFAPSTLFKVLKAGVRVNTAGASATQSFQVQISDSAGSFSSPTSICTVTITSGNAAAAQLSTVVAAASTDVDNSNGTNLYAIRFVHVATSTDASLDYDYWVAFTAMHA